MALTRAAIVGAWAVLLGACSPFGGGAFHCETNDQCGAGTCEPDGFCSFPDVNCESGRRYGELGGSLANTCVGEGAPTDGAMVDDMPLDDGAIDSPVDSMIDSPITVAFCNSVGEPTLVGCWEFENAATDASGDNNNATATNVTYATGKVGQAIVLQANSTLVVGDRASLEPPQMTVEAWVRPAQTPPAAGTGRWGVIDNDGGYGMFITSTNVSCAFNGTLTVDVILPVAAWTHLACTTDGATVRLYIDGVAALTTAGGQPLVSGNGNGIVLAGNSPSGDNFVGAIDQFRVFTTARTPAQICQAAGLSTCP